MLPLADGDLYACVPRLIHLHNDNKLLIYRRGAYLFALSFHPFAAQTVTLPPEGNGKLTLVLNSSDPAFGGSYPAPQTVKTAEEGENGAFALSITLPPRTALVYRVGKAGSPR